MKEEQRKEDRTNGQSLNVSGDTGWARCPICNDKGEGYMEDSALPLSLVCCMGALRSSPRWKTRVYF